MANPFTTGPFNCCSCPEPPDYDPEVDDPLPKYVSLCGCPSVSIVCTSSQKNAQMCGIVDPDSSASPPEFYKSGYAYKSGGLSLSYPGGSGASKVSFSFSRDESGNCVLSTEDACWYDFDDEFYTAQENEGTAQASGITVQSGTGGPAASLLSDGCFTLSGSGTVTKTMSCPDDDITFSATGTLSVSYSGFCDTECDSETNTAGIAYSVSATLSWSDLYQAWRAVTTLTRDVTRDCYGLSNYTNSYTVVFRESPTFGLWSASGDPLEKLDPLSLDSEEDALAAAAEVSGSSCSSIYELRTTASSFIYRTVTYTATASNLVVGVEYEGCVRIQRREAYSGTAPEGADTDWHDVEPDTIAAFTATDTEEEVATDVELPNAQGYEYRALGAYIWPTSAGCDCPTDYVAP